MSEHESGAMDADELRSAAIEVLEFNDVDGRWTQASPGLYPHQWSWDSAFIAIGWAHVDPRRAMRELHTLFEAQWTTGQVPQIVFNPEVPLEGYFPDWTRWACAELRPDAVPTGKLTTGLVQPPVHALAAWRIREVVQRGADPPVLQQVDADLKKLYPKLLAWHRYLHVQRDPEGTGLITIYHPWESGTDNSPRWDEALPNVTFRRKELPKYVRRDRKPGADWSQRPTDEEYDRYLWLVELLKRARYDDAAIYSSYPFLIKDVLFSAILVAADEALRRIAEVVAAPDANRESIEGWIARGRDGLDSRWDPVLGLAVDYDLRAQRPIRVKTVAGFAPLVAGGLSPGRRAALLATLDSPAFLGHHRRGQLARPLPPSTSPEEPEPRFRARTYWRGPTWPFFNWLLWWALVQNGAEEHAARLRRAALDQIAERGFRFAEYAEPFTGEPLGSFDQSWTAAVTLDWLAQE